MKTKLYTPIVAAALVLITAFSTDFADAGSPGVQWKFGMDVKLEHTLRGKGLAVKSVSPHGAASRALRYGDVILSSNNQRFEHAHNSYDARRILQGSVRQGRGGGGGGIVPTHVQDRYRPSSGIAQLVVLRHGRVIKVTVYPEFNGHGGGSGIVPTYRR